MSARNRYRPWFHAGPGLPPTLRLMLASQELLDAFKSFAIRDLAASSPFSRLLYRQIPSPLRYSIDVGELFGLPPAPAGEPVETVTFESAQIVTYDFAHIRRDQAVLLLPPKGTPA